jgi:hypothetical protein
MVAGVSRRFIPYDPEWDALPTTFGHEEIAAMAMSAPVCPYCHKRLPVRDVTGTAIVYCRHCKREIAVTADGAR